LAKKVRFISQTNKACIVPTQESNASHAYESCCPKMTKHMFIHLSRKEGEERTVHLHQLVTIYLSSSFQVFRFRERGPTQPKTYES